MPFNATQLVELNNRFEKADTAEVLRWAWDTFGKRAAIGTSFQGAGLVMIHIAQSAKLPLATRRTPIPTKRGEIAPAVLALRSLVASLQK